MNISIIGAGYVGLVSGACLAKFKNKIICVDIDDKKIEKINSGASPIYEEGLDDIIIKNKDRILATTDYKSSINNTEITFICVGTPSNKDGSIDLKYVKDTAKRIGELLKNKDKYHIVVVKSTVLPGTTRDIILPILEKYSGKKAGVDFGVAMNPEFLREGVAVYDFLNPDRIIIGSYDNISNDILRNLYMDFKCPIVETSLSGAEMIKYASNCFLATKISFINEIGNICKKLGIDTYQVADGVGLDKRIGRAFLDSGIGWGGSCFPKDLDALLSFYKSNDEDARLIESTVKVNKYQPLKLIYLLKKHIPDLNGKTIGVLGLAFKSDTDDIRESRSIPIVSSLLKEKALVKVYDPKAMDSFRKLFPDIIYCINADDVLDSDAVIIATKWDEFKKLDYKGKIVFDGRRLDEAKSADIYEGVCW
jgi:UDPglucose 6-dehydrogenase